METPNTQPKSKRRTVIILIIVAVIIIALVKRDTWMPKQEIPAQQEQPKIDTLKVDTTSNATTTPGKDTTK